MLEIGKEAVASGILPWWAMLILAQHSGASALMNDYRHYHHCADCGQVMICNHQECRTPAMYCPDCDTKKDPISRRARS
mgnify:CR=1 FL=1